MAPWNMDRCCILENDCITDIRFLNVQNKWETTQVGFHIGSVSDQLTHEHQFENHKSIIINDSLAECLMIYASIYWTFTFGNTIGLSGPIAIMAFNIFFDHSTISREAEITVKKYYDVVTFFAAIYLSGSVGFVWVEELWDHILKGSNVSGNFWPRICDLHRCSCLWTSLKTEFSMERYRMDCGPVCFRHCLQNGHNATLRILC